MSTVVMLLVLVAAILHASWNAIVKSSPDQSLDIVLVTGAAAMLCAVMAPFLPLPQAGSWPYLIASAIVHTVYFLLIGAAYRNGAMSLAYPLMRGAPPLLVALASGPLLGEHLTAGEWSGIAFICGGILGLLLVTSASGNAIRTMRLALLSAVTVAAYTLIDGTGVRVSGHAVSYTAWMFLLTAPPILAMAIRNRRADTKKHLRARWHFALAGGACTLGGYMLVLWAMTQAPIAMVAALRETAILFGMAISALVLKEPTGYSRPIAAVVILLGVTTLKLT